MQLNIVFFMQHISLQFMLTAKVKQIHKNKTDYSFFMTILFHFSYAKESKLTSTKAKGVINSIDNQVLTKHAV